MKDTTAEIVKVYINATVYQIWAERNIRKHSGKKTTAGIILERIVKQTRLYLQALLTEVADTVAARILLERIGVQVDLKQLKVTQCVWIAPPPGVLQLSCDGSVEKERAGYGGLLRESDGTVRLLYSGGSNVKSVITQELLAIWYGLKGARDMQVGKIEVTSDSLRAVRIIEREEDPPWFCRDLLAGIRLLVGVFQTFSIRHVFREMNQAADYLAGLDSDVGEFSMYSVGPVDKLLSVILEKDRTGVVYFRIKQ